MRAVGVLGGPLRAPAVHDEYFVARLKGCRHWQSLSLLRLKLSSRNARHASRIERVTSLMSSPISSADRPVRSGRRGGRIALWSGRERPRAFSADVVVVNIRGGCRTTNY
jgi:hypothetical protein